MPPIRFTEIDETNIGIHPRLTTEDKCFFLFEYTSGKRYDFSATNNLISTLKRKPGAKGQYYKDQAIARCATFLREALNPDWLATATLVPAPPSKAVQDPAYDNRMERICRLMGNGLDVRCLVRQTCSTVAAHAVLVGPLAVVDSATDRDEHALGRMLGNNPREAVEAGDPVPLRVLGGVAALVLVGLAFAVALHAAGAEAEARDIGAAVGRTKLGIAAEVPDEKNDVGHVKSPELAAGTTPSTARQERGEAAERTAGAAGGEPLGTEAWRGQPEGQHGPKGQGLRVRSQPKQAGLELERGWFVRTEIGASAANAQSFGRSGDYRFHEHGIVPTKPSAALRYSWPQKKRQLTDGSTGARAS